MEITLMDYYRLLARVEDLERRLRELEIQVIENSPPLKPGEM